MFARISKAARLVMLPIIFVSIFWDSVALAWFDFVILFVFIGLTIWACQTSSLRAKNLVIMLLAIIGIGAVFSFELILRSVVGHLDSSTEKTYGAIMYFDCVRSCRPYIVVSIAGLFLVSQTK